MPAFECCVVTLIWDQYAYYVFNWYILGTLFQGHLTGGD